MLTFSKETKRLVLEVLRLEKWQNKMFIGDSSTLKFQTFNSVIAWMGNFDFNRLLSLNLYFKTSSLFVWEKAVGKISLRGRVAPLLDLT